MTAPPIDRMSATEWRATTSLALVFALRMFGMFAILPVLAIHARELPGGGTTFLVGVALGIDGLAQALLQIPFGLMSDRFGRKRMIYIALALFALGSFIAAGASDLYMIILGRLVQGMGAVAAPIIALTADLTREQHRAKGMAMIGMSIGATFGASMVLGPMLEHWVGVPGIFAMTGVLALAAMAVIRWLVPSPQISRPHADAGTVPGQIGAVLKNVELQRLNFGIFSLHAGMRGLFVVVPLALAASLPLENHWQVYLPIMLVSFFGAVPAIIVAEKYGRMKAVFCAAIALLCVATLLLALFIGQFIGLVTGLFLFFLAFNLLEATLPSLVSKIAPAASKGTALGVYNSFQFLGLFLGGALGGLLVQHVGQGAVFVFSLGLALAWLMLALAMKPPPAVRTRLLHVGVMDRARARRLAHALMQLEGVVEAVVIASEGVAYLKVSMTVWDEDGANDLINEES